MWRRWRCVALQVHAERNDPGSGLERVRKAWCRSRCERISSRRKPAQTAADVLCPRSVVWVWQDFRPRLPPREAWGRAEKMAFPPSLLDGLERDPCAGTSGRGSSRSCSLASALQHRQAAPSHRGQPLSEIAPDRLGGHAGVVMQWKGAAASQFQACPLPNPPNSTRDDDRAVAPCLIVSMKRGGPADRTRGHIFAVPHHEPR